MNGKDYVVDAIGRVDRLAAEIRSTDLLDGDALLDEIAKARETLGTLKNRPTLRTKDGTRLAFPVNEAAQNMEEAWEEARAGADEGDLKLAMEEFLAAVGALEGALRDRQLVMT